MIGPSSIKKYLPFLLILAMALFLTQDQLRFQSHPDPGEKTHIQEADHDHSDPEANRRMGIFHFNEGNKAMREGKLEEAVKNYKMALVHNEDFQEAYINLSTAYLHAKRYENAYDLLQTLKGKNPSHPLLYYNLACYYSLTGRIAPSLESIQKAVALGFKNSEEIRTDPDLENLRNDPGFKKWFETIE